MHVHHYLDCALAWKDFSKTLSEEIKSSYIKEQGILNSDSIV